MRRILLSLMLIALIGALIGGGVYAVFTDTEASSSNQFAVGTLDLKVDDENPWTSTKISVSNLKPGDSGAVDCTLKNDGTIDGSSLTVDIQNLSDSEGTNPEPETDTTEPGDLSANLDLVLWVDDGAGGGTANNGVRDGTEQLLYSGKLNAEAGPYSVTGGLAAGATTYIGIGYSIASSVGNDIQGDTCTFDIVFVLTQ
ncbi:MAG: hypothetical protein DRI26_07070 [Chloroflexi bacterium]|nr:MAG: hypothetical protein DRI26_07070 [Chloroflexota bacterium]